MKEALPSTAERHAVKAGDFESFGGFSLTQTRRDLIELLGKIHANQFFEEYTKHDITHIDTMLTQMDWLIPQKTQEVMSPADWLLVVLGIYLHDLGMLVTRQEFSRRYESGFADFRRTIDAPTDDSGKDYVARITTLEHEQAERFLYQEFVRVNHARRIRDWIQGTVDPKNGISSALVDEVGRILAPLDEVFRDDLANVCESHHLDDLYDLNKYPISRPYGPSAQETANVQYAAVLLRTVDLLHITRDRTPSIAFRIIDPQDPISQIEWAKQSAVRSIRPRLGIDSEGNFNEEAPKDTIEVHARFSSGDGFFGLTSYLSYAQDQLKKSHEWVSHTNRTQGSHHMFPWKKVDTSNIETKGFLSKPFEFTFDQSKVLDLLTGHTLYNDSSVVVRELIQNSLDAVRLAHESHTKTSGKIVVRWNSNLRTLEVWDNGTGMTQEIIEQNLLKVGSSRYQDPRFRKENPNFSPISRFGIGILSAFMIADRVDIVTSHVDETEARQLSLRSVHGKYLVRLVSKHQDDTARQLGEHGTLVRLLLRPSAHLPEIVELVRKWIVLPDCDVVVIQDDSEEVKIGHESVKEALLYELALSGRRVTTDGISNNDFKVVAREEGNISLAYVLRWDSWFKEWAFWTKPDTRTSQKYRSGTCIQGVRVEHTNPGYRDAGPWAIVNISGPTAPQTNVARSAIESTPEYTDILRRIYALYCTHISDEISTMQEEREHSLTWAIGEANFLLTPLMAASTSADDLKAAVRELPLFIIEQEGVRRSASANGLMETDHLWTIDSAFSMHVEYILREMTSAASLSMFLQNINGPGRPSHAGPLLCNQPSGTGRASGLFLSDWEVVEIIADEENRRCDAGWRKIGEQPRWTPYEFGSRLDAHLQRALQDMDPELAYYLSTNRAKRYRVPLGPVDCSGFANGEVAALLGSHHHLLPGHPYSELISSSSGDVEAFKAMALSTLLSITSMDNTHPRRYGISAVDPEMESILRRAGLGDILDIDEFIRIMRESHWKVFNVRQWRRETSD